jgi:hypothetical protein
MYTCLCKLVSNLRKQGDKRNENRKGNCMELGSVHLVLLDAFSTEKVVNE